MSQMRGRDTLQLDSIKAVILDMFAAGTDATFITIEWAIVELIRHPRVTKELQEEVRNMEGKGSRVCEDDMEKLTYLKAVIKEALRLHPPGPLSVFQESMKDVNIDSFDITYLKAEIFFLSEKYLLYFIYMFSCKCQMWESLLCVHNYWRDMSTCQQDRC